MKNKKIDLIDLFKGFAVLSVIYLHSGFSDGTDKIVLAPFLFNLAVPIFMIISGFTYSISLSKTENSGSVLKTYYTPNNLYKKIIRLLPCYLVIFAIEMIIIPFEFSGIRSIAKLFYYFFTGGYVFPGSYYIPILIQLIIIFPLLKLIYDKLKAKAFIPVIAFQLIYELAIHYLNVPSKYTRLLIIRYLALIIGGIFIFDKYSKHNEKIKSKWVYIISFIIGGAYIIATGYFDFQPEIIFKEWTSTALPTAFYLIPVIMLLLFKFGEKEIKPVFTIIGKASYHIYLFQMIYFGIITGKLPVQRPFINCIAGVCFSVILGLIMYFIENKITKAIKAKRSKNHV